MSDVHTVASEGFNIGQAYHLARPSYPVEAMRLIQAAIDKDVRPLEVVEHGAGSGLFTQLLTAPPMGYPTIPLARLTAIEPSASMRQAFDAAVLPGAEERGVNVRCLSGTFTAFPEEVADGTVDSVIIAQAFHWAHPHYDGAMAAIARALKPDGVAVFIWNMEREAGAPWVRKLRAAYQEHEAGSPQYRLRLWEAAFSTQAYTSAFAPPEYSTFQYKLRCSRSLAIERAFSKSYVSRLPDNEKATLRAELERVLDEGEGMERIDPPEGSNGDDSWFSYPYETEVVVMRKTA